MNINSKINSELIAPCGMNCGICLGQFREKNKCPGCRARDAYESFCGRKCIIRSCEILKENKLHFCSDKCEKFPCKRLKNLDKRYRTKYNMSMLENLEYIKKFGIKKFVKSEQEKWVCLNCGELLCVHRNYCLNCGVAISK